MFRTPSVVTPWGSMPLCSTTVDEGGPCSASAENSTRDRTRRIGRCNPFVGAGQLSLEEERVPKAGYRVLRPGGYLKTPQCRDDPCEPLVHIRAMSAAAIHLVHRNPTTKRPLRLPGAQPNAPCNLVRPARRYDSENAGLRLSPIPLSDPVEILRQMPAQALTPALLELLDLMSSPILLVENSPTGEWREAAALRPVLAMVA